MNIGYARVSSGTQNLDRQLDALKAYKDLSGFGCDVVYTDRSSGSLKERPGLTKAMNHLCPGDVLVILSLDRVGRSLQNLVELVGDINKKKAHLKVLTGGVDTTTKEGQLIFGIMASLAEYERSIIRERQEAGIKSAQARGTKFGSPSKLTTSDTLQAQKMMNAGECRKVIAEKLHVDRTTLYRAIRKLKEAGRELGKSIT